MIERVGGQISSPPPNTKVEHSPAVKKNEEPPDARQILTKLLNADAQRLPKRPVEQTGTQHKRDEFAPHLGRFLDVMA